MGHPGGKEKEEREKGSFFAIYSLAPSEPPTSIISPIDREPSKRRKKKGKERNFREPTLSRLEPKLCHKTFSR